MTLNNRLRGMSHVFRFSVQQHYAMIGIRILLLALFVIALAAFPAARLFLGDDTADIPDTEATSVTRLYLRNETGIPFDHAAFSADARYTAVEIVETESSDETFGGLIAESRTYMAASAVYDPTQGIMVQGFYGANTDLEKSDAASLTAAVADVLHRSLMDSASVTEEQAALMNTTCTMKVTDADKYDPADPDSAGVDTETHGMVSLYYSMMVMILGSLAMGYIFQLCVDEKSSKLVELLMVSIQPAALLFGKILAVTMFVTVGIAVVLLGLLISYLIAKSTGSVAFIHDLLESAYVNAIFEQVNVGTLFIVLFSVLIGYATLVLLSSIPAACCSKNEDVQSASIYTVLIVMLGYMAGAFVPMFESTALDTFFSLCPFFSVFIAPANYLCGKLSLPLLLVSWVIALLFMFVLLLIADRVYRMMILYRGNTPKLKDIIRLWKNEKSAKEVPHEKA